MTVFMWAQCLFFKMGVLCRVLQSRIGIVYSQMDKYKNNTRIQTAKLEGMKRVKFDNGNSNLTVETELSFQNLLVTRLFT